MDYAKILVGGGVGAGMMYLLDRQEGRRRRAVLRDKAVHGAHVTQDATGKVSRDTRNRVKGFTAEIKRRISGEGEEVDDRVLTERVRSDIGTAVSHPGSIQVITDKGRVKLSGVILAAEVDNLIRQVKAVPGVREVVDELEVHQEPGGVPGLQGDGSRRLAGGRFELWQENWSPAARFIMGVAGAGMMTYGLIERKWHGAVAVAAGLPLFARAITNMPLQRMVGLSGRRGVDIEKTININAPLERVFDIFMRMEEYPNFMTHVKKVSHLGEDVYQWTVIGPAGAEVSWDSKLTSIVPNRQIAWRTVSHSLVKNAGMVKFRTNPDGSTAVHVRMTYNPLIGGIGHALLTVLGTDPKTLLDEDLLRAKLFIETGKQPRDAAARR